MRLQDDVGLCGRSVVTGLSAQPHRAPARSCMPSKMMLARPSTNNHVQLFIEIIIMNMQSHFQLY